MEKGRLFSLSIFGEADAQQEAGTYPEDRMNTNRSPSLSTHCKAAANEGGGLRSSDNVGGGKSANLRKYRPNSAEKKGYLPSNDEVNTPLWNSTRQGTPMGVRSPDHLKTRRPPALSTLRDTPKVLRRGFPIKMDGPQVYRAVLSGKQPLFKSCLLKKKDGSMMQSDIERDVEAMPRSNLEEQVRTGLKSSTEIDFGSVLDKGPPKQVGFVQRYGGERNVGSALEARCREEVETVRNHAIQNFVGSALKVRYRNKVEPRQKGGIGSGGEGFVFEHRMPLWEEMSGSPYSLCALMVCPVFGLLLYGLPVAVGCLAWVAFTATLRPGK